MDTKELIVMVTMLDIIQKKKGNLKHTKSELKFLIDGIVNNSIPDYQLSAWLMSVYFNSMDLEETSYITKLMMNSGDVLDFSDVGDIIGDKHSTGGVGDKTTLVFVPLMAALGLPMAKLSGRGLGFSGGTIDKLEAIPGFNATLTSDQFKQLVKKNKMAISAQSQSLAPADGKLYALRDVTCTIDSMPLIAASVLSKKFASGTNLIILDVKCGKGAFMEDSKQAINLAKFMVDIGYRLNKHVLTVVTDMNQPLGYAVGNAIEVKEAIDTLAGNGPADLVELTLSLGSVALTKAKLAQNIDDAKLKITQAIQSGLALEYFAKLIQAQGGNSQVIENPKLMPQAKYIKTLTVNNNLGNELWISDVNGKIIAMAAKLLGAGRSFKGEKINLAVGIEVFVKIGQKVFINEPLATVYADTEDSLNIACDYVYKAVKFSLTEVETPPLILGSYE